MSSSNTRELEDSRTARVASDDEQTHCYTVATDGGQPIGTDDLTRFQLDLLVILSDGADYGLGIKETLEARYDAEVNHGRLYPNLDRLVEADLVAKHELDKRTNEYRLTPNGVDVVAERLRWMADQCGLSVADGDHRLANAEPATQEVSD